MLFRLDDIPLFILVGSCYGNDVAGLLVGLSWLGSGDGHMPLHIVLVPLYYIYLRAILSFVEDND